MSQELNKLLENPSIAQTKLDYIKSEFIDFTSIAEEWKDKAYSIVVTDEKQLDLMEQAKEGKKLLKAKRIEIEKKRKLLKEQSLNEGRLIDSIAKHLTSLIEPAEKYLELQEKYAETKEWERKQSLKRERYLLLEPYFDVIDPNTIQLDIISEEAFTTILNGAKYGLEQKRAEEKRLEEERIAEAEKERLEKEAMQKELQAERERSQAIQKQLDESKKNERTATIKLKEVAVELKTIKKTQSDIVEAVSEYDSELEMLKTKCSYYESALEKVLFFIVPDNCRGMVEQALKVGKSNFTKY
jgi:hypothetical protein